ncbi:MAG: DedA family protein [Xanthomonadales bacterium]|nr:DedA family protein [Xanthomonadales bacterium]
MRVFSALYDRVIRLARHRHAEAWLGGLSFAESSFFPVPPDVMLAPMVLARPERAWRLATLTTVTSVLGGLLGYLIGWFLIDAALPLVERAGYLPAYQRAVDWFGNYGFWAILLAGFTPIPYKVFTIAAGAMGMSLPVFLVGSIAGRGGRFYLVAWLCRMLGPVFETRLLRWIDLIGWSLLALIALGGGLWWWLR